MKTLRTSKNSVSGVSINTSLGHFGGESFQSIALVPTAKHRKTREYTYHRKENKENQTDRSEKRDTRTLEILGDRKPLLITHNSYDVPCYDFLQVNGWSVPSK